MELVTLTIDGRHLAPGPAGDRRLRRSTDRVDGSAVFERLELPHGRIALRTLDGRFLATRPDPDLGFGVYPQEELTPEAVFEEVLWPDGQVSLRSCHLTYLSSEAGRAVRVNRVQPDLQARFRMVPVTASAVPAQRRARSLVAEGARPRP